MDIYKRLKRLYTEEEEKEQKKEEEKKDNSDIIISKEYMNSYLPALEEDRTESYAGDKIDEFVEKPEPAYNPVETVTITSRPSQTVAEKTTPSLLDKETLTNQNASRSFAEEKALDVTKGLNRNELTETYKIYTDKVASAIKQNNYYDFYENYIVAKEVEDMLKANNLFDVIGDGVEALAYGANTSFYTVMDGINKVINNYKYSDDNLNSSLLYKIASGTSNSVEETLNSGRNYLNNLHIQFPDDKKITMLYDYVTNGNFKGDQKEIADLVQYANLKERANANETYYNTYTKKAKELQERSELKTDLSYDGIAKQIVKGAEGVGNMGSAIVLNTIAGGGGLTMLALSAYSNAFEEAKKDGANESQANWYAILNSASEIASELIGGENVNAVLVKPLSTTPLGEAINSFIESQGIRSKFARSVIRNIGQVGAEFTEEMATATIDPILKYISYGYQQFPNAPEEYIKSIFDSGLDSISTTLLLSGIGKAETLAVLNKNQQNYEKAIRNSPYFNQEQKATMLKELQEATNQAKEVVTKDYEKTLKDLKSKLDNRKAQYQKNIGTVLENQTLTPEERANVVIKYNDKMVEQADVGSQTTQEIIDNNEKVRTSIADDIKAEIGRILDNNQKVQGIEPTEEISKSKSNIVNLINRISGLNMVLADIKSSDGSTINGFTNKKGSTVYVNSNMNLKDTLSTALHEVGHHYRITYSDIFNKFVKKAGIEAENDLTREYREAHGMEDAPLEDVQEDMFGDYIGEILSKPKNVKSLEKSTRDIASIFQSILAGDMSNSKVSSYNLDFTSKLGGDIINDTNFEKELLNSIKKQKTFAKPVIKKSESTTSQKKTDSKEEKKNRETNKETPINNIVKRYNQMKEAAEDRPPAFEKMIADELGVEYNTKKSLNDPRISSIYEQLKQGIPADEIKFSKERGKGNDGQRINSNAGERSKTLGVYGKAISTSSDEETISNTRDEGKNGDTKRPTYSNNREQRLSFSRVVKNNSGEDLSKGQQEYFAEAYTNDKGELIIVYHTTTGRSKSIFTIFNPVGTPGYKFGRQVVIYATNSKEMSASYAQGQITDVRNAKEDMAYTSIGGNHLRFIGYFNLKNPKKIDVNGLYWNKIIKEQYRVSMSLYQKLVELDTKTIKAINNAIKNDNGKSKININKSDVIPTKLKELLNLWIDNNPTFLGYLKKSEYTPTEFIKHELRNILEYADIYEETNDVVKEVMLSNYALIDQTNMYNLRKIVQNYNQSRQLTDTVISAYNRTRNATDFFDNIIEETDRVAKERASKYAYDSAETIKEALKDYDKINLARKLFDEYIYGEIQERLKKNEASATSFRDTNDIENIIHNAVVNWRLDFLINLTQEEILSIGGQDGVVFSSVVDYGGNGIEKRVPQDVFVAFSSNQFKLIDNLNPTKDDHINFSREANPYNKLNFPKSEVPKDDFHTKQYEYIKDRLTDVVGGFNIAPEYDIKIRKDDPKRPDLFEVELYDKKGKLKGIIRVGNKGMWRKVDSTLGKPVTTLKLSDYKTVSGLASSFKSAISKTFQEAINSLSDIKKAMKENDNSIAEKIGKKREIAEEKAKQREEKMNTDQEEYIKQTKEKETKKKIEDTEKQLKSDNKAFNKAVKNLGKKIEQLQASKEKFENAYEDLKKDSAYKLAIEKFETQFANKAKNSEYSFNSNDKANFVMLRIFDTNIENAFNEVVRMKEETFKRINSINRTIDMLKDLRRVYKKMPNDLKVRIDSYISIYTKAVNMTELTLHNKFITSEYIKEHLLGKVPLTKGIRNKILTDGKEMVSLGDLLSTTDLAEAFERGVRELYEEAIEELARNRLQEVKEDMQEQIDNIGKAVKLVAEDTARKRETQAKAGEVKGRIAYTFKTETQALMQGDVDTSLMQIERNLQNGETRKKIAINRFYAILNREMKDSSGVNKLIHSKKFKEDLEKTLSRKAEWLDTGIEVDGRKLRLPKSMILSLAMHLKNDDNMAHISGAVVGAKVLDGEGFVMPDIVYKEGGGIVVPNETLYKKGDLSKAYSRGETVKLSKKQVEDIVSMLSEEEKEFLNTVADIYKLSTKLINEVSREVLGYDLATVENYFPIHAFLMENVHHIGTDDMTAEEMLNNYKNNFGGASIFEPGKAIRNQGQLKERTTSFAPIYLENIAEVLNRSINDTSLFYGYTQDLIKNDIILASSYEDGAKTGGTTRKTLKNMLNYIDNNYLKDYYKLVNFILGREKLNNKIRSLIAQNTLTFNIGTWLVQPMSFFNTLKYFSTKEFMKSINPLNNHVKFNDMVRKYYNDLGYDTSEKDNFELVRDFIAEATPILENRAINFRIPGVNQLFNKRMIDKLGIKGISTFDDIAVTAIARMMAYSVSLDPSIKFGSDEYFEVLGNRLNQVLLETQPERSDINRANIFRSDNPFARIFSLFGTPPNQILNNVASSSMNFRYKLEYGSEEEKQEAFNSLAKSVAGAIASSVGTAVIRATRDKVRAGDDDDVPYLDRIVGQYLVAMLSPTIIGDEIATWIMQQAKYGGISFYDISSPEVSYLTNLTTLANKLSKLPSKDVSVTKKTVDIIKALGGVTGLDTRSLVHFTEAMLKFVFPDTYKAYTLLNNSDIYKRWAENKETDLSEFYVGYQVTRKKAIEAKGQKYNNESIKDALEEEGLGDLYEIFKLGKK